MAGGVARAAVVERGDTVLRLGADRAGDEYVRDAPVFPPELRLVLSLSLPRAGAALAPAAIKAMAVMSASFVLFMVPSFRPCRAGARST